MSSELVRDLTLPSLDTKLTMQSIEAQRKTQHKIALAFTLLGGPFQGFQISPYNSI